MCQQYLFCSIFITISAGNVHYIKIMITLAESIDNRIVFDTTIICIQFALYLQRIPGEIDMSAFK